jgi:putative DNA primase/helicase
MSAVEEWASRYISKYGLALVPIPPGHKAPLDPAWNQRGGYVTDIGEAQQGWGELRDHGIGAVLAPSGLCSLDVDTPEHAVLVLAELGIDLGALRTATPTIEGNPSRYRLMFKAPPGVVLGRKTLVWPARDPGGKPLTLFELRAGTCETCCLRPSTPGPGNPISG